MENKKPEENKMEIEISKYKDLVDALSDPVRVARMVLLIAAVAGILAAGIIAVVCGIKRFYPYKSINSNPYGATIIQDEDNEIIYWLFNTADLWANSGIKVKEGDVISVRTSGAFHTAIHHLVKDAKNNTDMKNLWVPSKGGGLIEKSPYYERDKARLKFCIAPDLEYNTILMQVVPEHICKPNWRTDPDNICYIDGLSYTTKDVTDHCKSGLQAKQMKPDIYDIGSGKESIRIRTDGVLHFAVNDIVLTRRVIKKMKADKYRFDELKLGAVSGVRYATVTERFRNLFTDDGWNMIKHNGKDYYIVESIKTKEDSVIISSDEWNKDNLIKTDIINTLKCPNKKCWNIETLYKNKLVKDGGFSELIKNPIGGIRIVGDSVLIINRDGISDLKLDTEFLKTRWSIKDDSIILNKYKCLCLDDSIFEFNKYLVRQGYLTNSKPPCEIDYYYDKGFVDAWFVDNIGSFMIVIERKRVK